ncbi:MAG: hypothetical protein IKX41_01880, partial [Oscillospiraceae bacterium]|nr:hypothetical protein [Oscillospiraceae bacterium]
MNKSYGERFFAFTRPRVFDPGSGEMCGRERKRGAVEALVGLMRGCESEIVVAAGPVEKISTFKYLILLDSDTKLTVGSAKKLVGTMLHPLVRPVVDEKKKRVVSGHGVVAPAISVALDSSNASRFASVFGGRGGTEPYAFSRSDVYQDLFGRGSFAGKGIVSVEAYDKCVSGRFPLNTVLSHDLPEGELLRCGFADDIELTDGFPSSPRSYWMRLHRWTRGDWQNIIWLGSRVKNSSGVKSENVFDGLSKWKIVDNLRRSLFAPACLVSLFAAFFIGGPFVLAGAAAAAALLFPAIAAGASNAIRAKKGREYRSCVLYGAGEAIAVALGAFAFLPQTAFTALSAAATAVYRLAVSKKELLRWTSSAEAENEKNSFLSTLKTMLPAVFIGAAALFSSPPGFACGLIWLLSPVFAYALGMKRKKPGLDRADKLYLRDEARSIWNYFSEHMTEERGFLPPDNWQEEPALGIAERTSPTNIGLALLSALAACELSFTGRGEACGLCERAAETLEKLEKRNGHLYNWYDLKTLRPMEPRFVSTVDSGNLAACLTAAAAILKRYGRDDIARRLTAVRDAMDFRELYDSKRELFCIGINSEGEREGLYDLFASEARLTSYFAIARGICTPKHWHELARPMARSGDRLGVASWNGSVFEYFMPELLLPLYENSLVWESLRFCLAVQLAASTPWGASESAFASLDETGSYRYKAHGAQDAAIRRKVYADRVAAPYASFLALSMWPKSAINNLRRFDALGAKGRFGFYEALDYTERRVPAGREFVPVKTFMAHHLGMSLVAAANALKDGVFVKAFLDDPEQAAFAELLQEKGPVGTRITTADKCVAEGRTVFDGSWENAAEDDGVPRTAVLSNGAYSLTVTSDGLWSSSCGDIALSLFDETGRRSGMFVSCGDAVLPLTGAVPDGVKRTCSLSPKGASFSSEFDDFTVESSWYVPEKTRGEVRRVRISNAGEERDFELSLYLEPVLSEAAAYLAHPAFSKLSMETRAFERGVTVLRREGGPVIPSAVSVAVSEPFEFDTSRESIIGLYGSVENALREPAASTAGAVLDPCVLLRCSLKVPRGRTREVVFSTAWGEDAESSESAASELVFVKSRPSGFYAFAARECCFGQTDGENVSALLLSLLYRRAGEQPAPGEKSGVEDLWRIGVSGDFSAAYVEATDESSLEKAKAFMRAAKYLRMCGLKCDLIVLFAEPDGYTRPISSALFEFLETLGRPNVIHIVDANENRGVKHVASQAGISAYRSPDRGFNAVPIAHRNGRFEDGAFVFETERGAGIPAWNHIMTNGGLGWLVADAGTFGLWMDNARENRLLRWINDPLDTDGAEKLCLVRGGREVSLFAARDEYGCRITYAPGYAVWERRIGRTALKTTGCVHYRENVRILEICAESAEPGDSIRWRIEPFPCDRPAGIRPVTIEADSRSV